MLLHGRAAHPELFCSKTASGSVDGFASWPITATGASAVTVTVTSCDETYTGSPSRKCNTDGTWGTVSNPCIRKREGAAKEARGRGKRGERGRGKRGVGVGLSFWSAAPARLTPDAAGRPRWTGHTVKYCAAIANDGNAAWPNATAGTTVQGTCITANGFEGTAIRACSAAAVWGSITTACTAVQPNCPAIVNYQGRSNWPSTASGVTATGTCAYGYTNSSEVFPQRKCLGQGAGVWDTTVEFDCTRTFLRGLHERLRAHTCHVSKRTLTPATLGPPCMRLFLQWVEPAAARASRRLPQRPRVPTPSSSRGRRRRRQPSSRSTNAVALARCSPLQEKTPTRPVSKKKC